MLNFLFNPNGRVSRREIWLFFLLPSVIAGAIANTLDASLLASQTASGAKPGLAGVGVFSLLVSLFYLWPSIAVPVKRLHDRNISGWWLLFINAAAIGLFLAAAWLLFGDVFAMLASQASAGSVSDAQMQAAMMRIVSGRAPGDAMLMAAAGLGVLIVLFVMLYLLPGTDGDNDYGCDPHRNGGEPQPTLDTGRLAATPGWSAVAERAIEQTAHFEMAEPAAHEETTVVRTMRQRDFAGFYGRASFGRRSA